jgi:hypothetical protein
MRPLTAKAKQILANEIEKSGGQTKIFYMSFLGKEGFRGALWTRAVGPMSAIQRCRELHIDPGGEILIAEIPVDAGSAELPPADQYDKLHDLDALERMFPMVCVEVPG